MKTTWNKDFLKTEYDLKKQDTKGNNYKKGHDIKKDNLKNKDNLEDKGTLKGLFMSKNDCSGQ